MHIHSLYFLLTSYILLFNFSVSGSSSSCASFEANKYALGSTFHSNLQQLLIDLAQNVPQNNYYYNATYGKAPDQVYGLAMCYADANLSACNNCLSEASTGIVNFCGLSKAVGACYDACMISYSNVAYNASHNIGFFASKPRGDNIVRVNLADPEKFIATLRQLINNLATNASTSPLKLATGTTNYTSSGKEYIYTLVQCTRQLPADDCRRCIGNLIDFGVDIEKGSNSTVRDMGLQAVSCYLRYAFDPFYVISEANPAWANTGKRSREPIPIHIFTVIIGALLFLVADVLPAGICLKHTKWE